MAGQVVELYVHKQMAANTNHTFDEAIGLGGFLCTVSGTFDADSAGVAVVDALAVTAGVYYPMPFACRGDLVITLSGGAAGTVGVAQ
jgi:hypothetical protein